MTSEGPKIVHIETRYVETDAKHFKDVVQRLTGKNSSMATIENGTSSSSFQAAGLNNNNNNNNKASGTTQHGVGRVCTKPDEYYVTYDGINNNSSNSNLLSSVLLNNVSFKDFDGWLSDLPSMDELLCL